MIKNIRYIIYFVVFLILFNKNVFADKEYKFKLDEPLSNQQIVYEWSNYIEDLNFQMVSPDNEIYDLNYDKIEYDDDLNKIIISFPEMKKGTWRVIFEGSSNPKDLKNYKEEVSSEEIEGITEIKDKEEIVENELDEDNTFPLRTLSETKDFSFKITYFDGDVDMTFISPTGKTYKIGDDMIEIVEENLEPSEDENMYRILKFKNAKEGDWLVNYVLEGSQSVEFDMIWDIDDEEYVEEESNVDIDYTLLESLEEERDFAREEKKEIINNKEEIIMEKSEEEIILEMEEEIIEEVEEESTTENVIILDSPNEMEVQIENQENIDSSLQEPLVQINIDADEERQKAAEKIKRQENQIILGNVLTTTPLVLIIGLLIANLIFIKKRKNII